MYTKFHDNTIQTKFVKALVAQTHIPTVNTWTAGDFVVAGNIYVSKDYILKCNHTGYPASIKDVCRNVEDHQHTSNMEYFTIIDNYNFGRHYAGITSNYLSSYLGYDAMTHFYLGNYLRAVRDFEGVNLMPFYNCFCGEYVQDISFEESSIKNNTDKRFKTLSVPVHFGKRYTIAIDSDAPISMMCVIYGNKGILYTQTANLNDTLTGSSSNSTFAHIPRSSFSAPFVYETKSWNQISYTYDDTNIQPDDINQSLGQYEKYLRLLIQIPSTNVSSVVVLEGDYNIYKNSLTINEQQLGVCYSRDSHINTLNLTNGMIARPVVIQNTQDNKWCSQTKLNEDLDMLSPLGLLQVSDKNIYAFSDRLIEYLLLSVIDYRDTISKNVSRVQKYVTSAINKQKNGSVYTKSYVNGVFDKNLREYLYNLAVSSKYIPRKIDITGFVDKDVESVITRGQGV